MGFKSGGLVAMPSLVTKPPAWNQIRADASQFAARWANETDENAGAQAFWTEFLHIFGIDRKRVATFEARAQRSTTGGQSRPRAFPIEVTIGVNNLYSSAIVTQLPSTENI